MKTIVFILTILFTNILWAQEYGPHTKVIFDTSSESRMFSGTVIESEESKIKVLTCWHGTMGFKNVKQMSVQLFCDPVENTQLSATVSLGIVRSDADKDILLLSGPNPLKLKIKRLSIRRDNLPRITETASYGFAQSNKLIRNRSFVLSYDSSTQGGFDIMTVNAPVIYGMSGGGVVYNNELCGVQSSGKDGRVSYCPAEQLVEFIK